MVGPIVAIDPEGRVIAVTGATGFIGSALCSRLEAAGRPVRRITRRHSNNDSSIDVGEIGPDTDWTDALVGVDCVVHTAARAHISAQGESGEIEKFAETNEHGTRRLAEQAAECGVRRLVFLSTVGVLGDSTDADSKYDNRSKPAPASVYAKSKWAAECALESVSRHTGLQVVVVRSPLVYGTGAPGNIGRLVRLLNTGLPIPFGSIRNKRSFVSLENLLSLLVVCVDHTDASGETFLVSDGVDLSTAELYTTLADLHGRRARIVPMPMGLLRLAAKVAGKPNELAKLTDSLRVDIGHTVEKLRWRPKSPRAIAANPEPDTE